MNISQKILHIQSALQNYPKAQLLVVTKKRSECEMKEVLENGITLIGENRVQEMVQKQFIFPKNTEKHMIGHLQRNKVKKALQLFDCIESVDSIRLAEKINQEAELLRKIFPIYLQVNISHDKNKTGFLGNDLFESYKFIAQMKSIKVSGIMCITRQTDNKEEIRKYYKDMKQLHTKFIHTFNIDENSFELSMGMSSDFKIALEEGATVIRIGSYIFEE